MKVRIFYHSCLIFRNNGFGLGIVAISFFLEKRFSEKPARRKPQNKVYFSIHISTFFIHNYLIFAVQNFAMTETKHNWTKEEILEIYNKPLMGLIYEPATIHREYHNPLEVQVSSLISIKTGGCSEDCAYCPQAARYHTDIEKNDLMTQIIMR